MSLFRRRLMMASVVKSLPYDAEVEYLELDGDQWFELPVYPNEATDAIQISFRRTVNSNGDRFCFSGSAFNTYATSSRVGLLYGGAAKTVSNTNRSNVKTQYHRTKFDYKNKRVTQDSFTNTFSGSSPLTGDSNLNMFGKYGDNPTFKGPVHDIKYWRNDVLMFDIQPVRKDGVGYFYDKIGRRLYGNQGTGAFGIGYDKFTRLSDYTLLDYISSNSNAFINTGVKATGDTSVRIGFKFNATSGTRYVFGARLDQGNRLEFLINSGSSNTYRYYRGASSASTLYDTGIDFDTDHHDLQFNPDSIIIDEQRIELSSVSINSQLPILLFNSNQQNASDPFGATNAFTGEMSYAQIIQGGVTVRDYVPVLHPAGIYGFFERCENRFYDSANALKFSGGFNI